MTRSHPAVGIDLGTTNSAVAYVDASGRPETIRTSEGGLTTPSVVFFDDGGPVVGSEACEAGVDEPNRMARCAKRDMGRPAFHREIGGQSFPPEVLQALVLGKLKQDAELRLGEIERAVVTVPAFFNEPCRKATQDAARLAGLDLLDIINEPTAAAICYGVQRGFLTSDGRSESTERVLVYDLGGGTFDVTLMQIDGRDYQTLATAGDVYLGGVDWDQRIVDHLAELWQREHKVDLRTDANAWQELFRKANQAKHALSQRESATISYSHQGARIRSELDRDCFASLTEDLLERTMMTVQFVLDEASIGWRDLSRVILVGGSTRMTMIRDELSRLSGLELDRSLSPDEAVAHGAAIYAGLRLGQKCESFSGVSVTNVNSHDLGVLAKDPKTGKPRRQVMIKRNTALPSTKRVRFRTHQDGQSNVKIDIVEGGDDQGNNATKIGKCRVDHLPPDIPKGSFVDVRFDYSQDGRLTVGATLPQFDCSAEMTLDRAAGMTEESMRQWARRIEENDFDLEFVDTETADQLASNESGHSDPTDADSDNLDAILAGRDTASNHPEGSSRGRSPVTAIADAASESDGPIIQVAEAGQAAVGGADVEQLNDFLQSHGLVEPTVTPGAVSIEVDTIPAQGKQGRSGGTKKLRRVGRRKGRVEATGVDSAKQATSDTEPESVGESRPVKRLLRKKPSAKTDSGKSDWKERGHGFTSESMESEQ